MASRLSTSWARAGAAAALAVMVAGCAEPVPEGFAAVTIEGERFQLEMALDNAKRTRGLGGVGSIPRDGGMLFVFPDVQPRAFVMRDCLVPIDIAFLSDTGRVLALYAMEVEPAQREDESASQYERRLRRYPSLAPCRLVIETAGGTWERLGLEMGDAVSADFEGLKALAR